MITRPTSSSGAASRPDCATRPRILVTGFGPFPGAPVNPTERLIGELSGHASTAGARLAVLPVDYEAAPARLAALAADGPPDIAIHFGLSAGASGFTLERRARNEIARSRPDNAGRQPAAARIRDGAPDLDTSLPVDEIHAALAARGLPVAWSDDAGGYLCNYVFYLSRGHLCPGLVPDMAGFIHVPPLKEDSPEGPRTMSLRSLVDGAALVVETCRLAWRERHGGGAAA